MNGPVIDAASAACFLHEVAPKWEWFMRRLESEGGQMRFPAEVSTAIANLKIESYPLLYEKEAAIDVVVMHPFMSTAEIQQFAAELDAATPEDSGAELRDPLKDTPSTPRSTSRWPRLGSNASVPKMWPAMSRFWHVETK